MIEPGVSSGVAWWSIRERYLNCASSQREVFLRKTLALGPNLIEAQYALGFALWSNDERDAALAAWATGAEVGRFSPWGARCAAARETAQSGATPVRAR